MDLDIKFMTRAIGLATGGLGLVEPNPMVGAVIVRNGEELAGGYHQRFGGPHAEIEALAAAERAGIDVRGATMYVTLEPCCHHGKTGPCTEAVISAGIGRVVVAMADPDENVAGKGIDQLRRAGIQVDLGICEELACNLLAAYIKNRTKNLPWVICKWAQTADGALALPAGQGQWISGEASRKRVHEIRAYCDGICVGSDTVLADDPLLTNRSGAGKQLTRVVLDSNLRIPADSQLVRTAGESPLLVATTEKALAADTGKADQLRSVGVELISLPQCQAGVDLTALLQNLGRRGWTYLLVEGGPTVLRSFIEAGLADELLVFVSSAVAGPDETLPRLDIGELAAKLDLPSPQVELSGSDRLLRFVL